jgi:hypothetical protein
MNSGHVSQESNCTYLSRCKIHTLPWPFAMTIQCCLQIIYSCLYITNTSFLDVTPYNVVHLNQRLGATCFLNICVISYMKTQIFWKMTQCRLGSQSSEPEFISTNATALHLTDIKEILNFPKSDTEKIKFVLHRTDTSSPTQRSFAECCLQK